MTLKPPICEQCKYQDHEKPWSCKAFPEQIPYEILEGDNDHSKPLRGQNNNIVFEPVEKPNDGPTGGR
jgi:hypothetical protein